MTLNWILKLKKLVYTTDQISNYVSIISLCLFCDSLIRHLKTIAGVIYTAIN